MEASFLEILRTAPIFKQLSDEDRGLLAGVGQTKFYPAGRRVFDEGDPSEFFYSVLSGKVKVFKTTPSGKDIILAILGPGDPLGAVALYEERPFPATAQVMEDAVLIRIPRMEYFRLLQSHPSLVLGLLRALTQRMMEFTHRFGELAGGRLEARLARLFLKLGNEIGQPSTEGLFIPLALSRQDLADFTGTTIESAIRTMSRWSKQGALETRDDGFVIRDHRYLEKLSAS